MDVAKSITSADIPVTACTLSVGPASIYKTGNATTAGNFDKMHLHKFAVTRGRFSLGLVANGFSACSAGALTAR